MSACNPPLAALSTDLKAEAKRVQAESDESLAQLEELVQEAKALRARAKETRGAPIIHVVDDDEAFQKAIMRLLRAAGYEVRGYRNAGDFLLAKSEPRRGCILLDVRMPGPTGLDLQEALARRSDPLPVIFISGYGDVPTTVRAIKAGAADFLTKPVRREALLAAIENALARDMQERVMREQLTAWRNYYTGLTTREVEVFERVVTGKMNKEIASELGAAERTVKAHRASVMEKMHAASLAELVHIADQLRSKQAARANPAFAG